MTSSETEGEGTLSTITKCRRGLYTLIIFQMSILSSKVGEVQVQSTQVWNHLSNIAWNLKSSPTYVGLSRVSNGIHFSGPTSFIIRFALEAV